MIDTHCHLDNDVFESDIEDLILRARAKNVQTFIIPGADIRTLPKAQALAHRYEGVYFAAGIHPDEIARMPMCEEEALHNLRSYALDERCVAIGECGLDYYRLPTLEDIAQELGELPTPSLESKLKERHTAIKTAQKRIFEAQIQLAIELKLPLIVHIREASNDSYDILRAYKQAYGVLHCFNADRILLQLSERFYYGIGGVCTFKNARRLVEVLPLIPKERIVLETDAPYLTPHPHRGTRNEPSYIPLIANQIAQICGISEEEVIVQSTQNARRLFAREKNDFAVDREDFHSQKVCV